MLSVGQSMRERRGLLHWTISDSGATGLTACGRAVASRQKEKRCVVPRDCRNGRN
jgi:hypothetical protein